MENNVLTIKQAIRAGVMVSFVWLALCLILLLSQSNSYNGESLIMIILLALFGLPGGILGALAGYTIRKTRSLAVISIWAIAGVMLMGMGCGLLVAVMVLPQ